MMSSQDFLRETPMAIRTILATAGAAGLFCAGCTHTVKVVAPEEPITINLNVKIDQEVRVRLEDDIEEMIQDNPDIF